MPEESSCLSLHRPLGRRERNKQQKLDRITAAASELFAEHGVDDVTTQQIADKADIGTGTLFLYAKTKGELLLLVQNATTPKLSTGPGGCRSIPDALEAVMAIVRPIVECNRIQVDNGRTTCARWSSATRGATPQRRARIVAQTEEAIAVVLRRDELRSAGCRNLHTSSRRSCSSAWQRARTPLLTIDDIVQDIRAQVDILVTPGT